MMNSIRYLSCRECGKSIDYDRTLENKPTLRRLPRRFCTKECMGSYHDRLFRSPAGGTAYFTDVYGHDNGTCYLCGWLVLPKRTVGHTHPFCGQIDHYIPVSAGGRGGRNLRLTHVVCNLTKARLIPTIQLAPAKPGWSPPVELPEREWITHEYVAWLIGAAA